MKSGKFVTMGVRDPEALLADYLCNSSFSLDEIRSDSSLTSVPGDELFAQAKRWALYLAAADVVQDSPVFIVLRQDINSLGVFLGCLLAKLTPVVMKPNMPVKLAGDVLKALPQAYVLTDASLASLLQHELYCAIGPDHDGRRLYRRLANAIALDLDADAPCVGLLSSGSTGVPKVIIHRFADLLRNASMHADSIGLNREHHLALTLPFTFSSGLVAGFFAAMVNGCRSTIINAQRVNVRLCLENLAAWRVPGSCAAIMHSVFASLLWSLRFGTSPMSWDRRVSG